MNQALDQRVSQVFSALAAPIVLRKDLALQLPQQGKVPRYVAEFLLARDATQQPARVAEYLERYLPEPRDREIWLHRLSREGQLRVLDRLEARVVIGAGTYPGRLAGLDLRLGVGTDLADRHPGILAGGLWGMIDVELGDEESHYGYGEPYVSRFTPVQVKASLAHFTEGRHYFTASEWIDLLLTSAGYDPEVAVDGLPEEMRLRRRLLLLSRLLPFVQGNLHLLELGPKNTGKTYLARNLSAQAFVISGGAVTPANLFVHLGTGRGGLLAHRQVVAFDEVARLRLGGGETVAMLKDFLESGRFSRGRREIASEASVVLLGNIDVVHDQPSPRYRHLCEPLPAELRDSAFLDRFAGFLPGWELPKIRRESLATGVGFVSDYFGEVLLQLRALPYEDAYRSFTREFQLRSGMTRRDEVAVERLATGLLKLVFPGGAGTADRDIALAILQLAGELRERVHRQLSLMAPGEFQLRPIGFEGVPVSAAADLLRGGSGQAPHPGVYALDRAWGPDDAGGALHRLEASLGLGQGPRVVGTGGRGRADAVRLCWHVLRNFRRELGLAGLLHDGLTPTVSIGGELRDVESAALPLFLAVFEAARHKPWQTVVAACGTLSLSGRISAPADLIDRLGALPEVRRGVAITGLLGDGDRARIQQTIPAGWEFRTAGSVTELFAVDGA